MNVKKDIDIPYLTAAEMTEVDRAMVEDYRIDLIQMMENAGRNLAALARKRFLDGDPRGKRIAVLAGSGGNGGGALVAARRLRNWGADIQVAAGRAAETMTPVAARQLDILRRMEVPVTIPVGAATVALGSSNGFDLILDGLIGYSLQGRPRGIIGELIRWADSPQVPILALDVPSGVDATTGKAHDPAITATATMTLALPKAGLRAHAARVRTGELYLADIGVPPELYARPPLGFCVGPLFAREEIVRLW